jgi:hypothetical protein
MDSDLHGTLFGHLVDQVRQRAATPDPAGLLDAAVAISADCAADADRLLDHFVAHARSSGVSWTDIGARLGVSKQAARQRFADTAATGALPYAARLKACLDQAREQAHAEGAHEIGTQHLLAGLLTDGVAATILDRLGVHVQAVRDASHRLFGPPADTPGGQSPPMSADATCALDAAARNAAMSAPGGDGQPEVRTEHLLAVLALDPGSRARRVLNDLGVDIAALKRELQCYLTVTRPRPARWWKRRPPAQDGCSFCGRTYAESGQLVNGPGVAICRNCIALAADILHTRQPAH